LIFVFERITNNKQSLNYEQTNNTRTHSTKMSARLAKFNQTMSALAKPFKPGSQWMKTPQISWHRLGITDVRYFDVTEGALARKAGENSTLKGPPASPIKDADRDAAMPFKIAPIPDTVVKLCEVTNFTCTLSPLPPHILARTQPNRFNYCDN
jgi:hypothetical protein